MEMRKTTAHFHQIKTNSKQAIKRLDLQVEQFQS